ncbi:MAG: UvrABC system protein C [Candidatus Parcubacteria bacterium]|nr:MAG: UvrABC system protein C [Candidatus Parcubacteria bacterium]
MIDKDKIKNLSSGPGVYIFKDDKHQPLYVGKAKNLKKRIEQYFKNNSLKIKKLLNAATQIETLETKNEIEAIFKESDLIKKLNPPFNQLLRDDSRYFYLIFTKETFPKVLITHQPEKFNYQEIIGPFFEGTILNTILATLRKNIPFCNCQNVHNRQCLNAHLKLCYGWCCLKNHQPTKEQIKIYNNNLTLLKKIFLNDLKQVKKMIIQNIKKSLIKNELEKATKLKNIYLSLKSLEENQTLIKDQESLFIEHEYKKILLNLKEIFSLKKIPHLIEVYDVSHFAGKEKVGISVSFVDGIYQPTLTKKFNIKTVIKPDDPRMIYEILHRRLNHKEWGLPDLIIIDGGRIQYKFAKQALEEAKLKIDLLALAKPQKEIYSNKKKIKLDAFPLIKNFIINLDQKAHQLVINFHRRKREQRFYSTIKK